MDLLVRVPLENVYFSGNINILENMFFLQNLVLKGQIPAISSFPGFSVTYPKSADYHWPHPVLAIRDMGYDWVGLTALKQISLCAIEFRIKIFNPLLEAASFGCRFPKAKENIPKLSFPFLLQGIAPFLRNLFLSSKVNCHGNGTCRNLLWAGPSCCQL